MGWDDFTDEEKLMKRGIELNNGRAAMMGILALMVHEMLNNDPYVINSLLGYPVAFNWEVAHHRKMMLKVDDDHITSHHPRHASSFESPQVPPIHAFTHARTGFLHASRKRSCWRIHACH